MGHPVDGVSMVAGFLRPADVNGEFGRERCHVNPLASQQKANPMTTEVATTIPTACSYCRTEHDQGDLSYCPVCDSHACIYCSCPCEPITDDAEAKRAINLALIHAEQQVRP
jgi:hypothetical protein